MPRPTSATRLFIVLSVLCGWSVAQAQDPLQAPPPVQFERWRQLTGSEFAERYQQTFSSAFQTIYPENNLVRLTVSLPVNRINPVPVVVLLHYWGASDRSLEADMAEELATRGIAAVAIDLPYHLDRTPKGHRSGDLAIRADPDSLVQTMAQAVSDVRRAVDWIDTKPEFDHDKVALAGTSLGAVIGSLAFAKEPRFVGAAFLLGGVDMASLMFNSSRVIQQREALRAAGHTEESLRAILKPVEPSEFLVPTDTRPTLMVSARHDTVVPSHSSDLLATRLGNTKRLFIDTGHFGGFFAKAALVKHVNDFFDFTLNGRFHESPDVLPTLSLRLMVGFDPESYLQVGIGVDVWRSNNAADWFGTAFVTPQGARLYLGLGLGDGFSIGAMVGPKRTSPAILWTTVF